MGFSQNEIILQAFRRGKSIGLRLSASEIILSYSLGIGEYVDETKGAFFYPKFWNENEIGRAHV